MAGMKKMDKARGIGGRIKPGVEGLRRDILDNLFCNQAKFPAVATKNDYYQALAYAVRDRLMHRWIRSAQTFFERESRTVIYLSAEYLMGPQLGNNLINLGLWKEAKEAVRGLGQDLDDLLAEEEEPGLGNGGLGRLAACYMDSLATLKIPAIGYGIRYEYGIFDQAIRDGWQVEVADKWLRLGNPWEVAHPQIQYPVHFGGYTEYFNGEENHLRVRWIPARTVMGTPSDTPVLGYGHHNANILRLWRAEAAESFDFAAFNVGDYYKAVEDKMVSENITKVLYPNDEAEAGRRLRLEQQFFFVSCSLQDMLRIFFQRNGSLDKLAEKYVVQLNDTHPALAVAEMMRLLVDEHQTPWERAWDITCRLFAYTNHTLLPEALETWAVDLFGRILPRHLEIIYEINQRFLDHVRLTFPGDEGRLASLSIIEEGPVKRVRMANLACVGSSAINGVAELHTELLQKTVLSDFYALWPDKFSNKTNGVTPRRFLLRSNPPLSALIVEALGGTAWVKDLERLRGLERLADDSAFQEKWKAAQKKGKEALARHAAKYYDIRLDPDTLFDVQVKRIHEYKRQHLNALHVISLYQKIKRGEAGGPPRTVIFGGKAAPGYWIAKLMIKLVHNIAEVVNSDSETNEMLKVVFLPDFNVKNAQKIYPAADLSQQISTAGYEASGTGNMKFALNGALTIGTLDGANIEIRDAVGPENFFLFGLETEEVRTLRERGYNPRDFCQNTPDLMEALTMLDEGAFSRGDRHLFAPLLGRILDHDEYMVCADFAAYGECREKAAATYLDSRQWTRMSILNTARMGRFSSDRSIAEYCRDIWHVDPVPVEL